jgi:tetratricopeptide (TPR) repeat protein
LIQIWYESALARKGEENLAARLLFCLITFALLAFGCAAPQHQATIDQYNHFAIESAKLQLWNEAVFRWERILKIHPQDAQAHNNLGVAYEALGKTDKALESYERATELDPTNKFYRFNHRKCRLHVQRNMRKQPDADTDDVSG